MANRQAFGRRTTPRAASGSVPTQAAAPNVAAVEAPLPRADAPSLDAELLAWKQARGSQFKMPWSQLSLMASLCFGIASFVLPDSVNDSVQWLLWGLTIMSAWVWYSNRRKKKEPTSPVNAGHQKPSAILE
jgi:hypothetical protein